MMKKLFRITSEVVSNQRKITKFDKNLPLNKKSSVLHPQFRVPLTNFGLSKSIRGTLKLTSGIGISTQLRDSHTDIKAPDFTLYRRDSVKCPTANTADSEDTRRVFTSWIGNIGLTVFFYGVKAHGTHYVMVMAPSRDVLALAKIEIRLSDIPEGKNTIFKWRGKPLFVKHRTPLEIETERSVDLSTLRDPEDDKDRVKKDEWLVVIGVCTHLGCVPMANSGDWPGGFYCPCHGSHYDAAGRVRKGPAPSNLEVPEYEFPNDDTLIVG